MLKPFKRALIYAKLQLKFYAKKYTRKQDLNSNAQHDQEKVIDDTARVSVRVKVGMSLRNGMWNDVRNGIIMQNTSCGMT